MYQIYREETKPESIDLISLANMKQLLNLTASDPSKDSQIALIITEISAAMARAVNRVFGYHQVHETFYGVDGEPRLYFSKVWPVKFDDIDELTENGVDILDSENFILEESTGTLYRPSGFSGTVDCFYSGGYKLPDEAPPDLSRAANAAISESYYTVQRGMLATGVRMLSHKGARIQFQPPPTGGQSGGAISPATWNAMQSTLDHYFRHWI